MTSRLPKWKEKWSELKVNDLLLLSLLNPLFHGWRRSILHWLVNISSINEQMSLISNAVHQTRQSMLCGIWWGDRIILKVGCESRFLCYARYEYFSQSIWRVEDKHQLYLAFAIIEIEENFFNIQPSLKMCSLNFCKNICQSCCSVVKREREKMTCQVSVQGHRELYVQVFLKWMSRLSIK